MRWPWLLPEVIAIHLESEPSGLGANWAGRTTKRFGPEPVATPVQGEPRMPVGCAHHDHRSHHHRHHHHHHGHHDPEPYF